MLVGICDDLTTVPCLCAFSIARCCALVIAYIRLQGRDLEHDLLLGTGVALLRGRDLERDLGFLISISVCSY